MPRLGGTYSTRVEEVEEEKSRRRWVPSLVLNLHQVRRWALRVVFEFTGREVRARRLSSPKPPPLELKSVKEKKGVWIYLLAEEKKRCEEDSSAKWSIPGGENQCEKWQVEHSEKAPVELCVSAYRGKAAFGGKSLAENWNPCCDL